MIGLETLQAAIDYIEEHLLEDINYEDVAKFVHMSPYEFHRTFSFIAGITVNTYIRYRRLSIAGQELMHTDAKVIDIALKYCFESADGFAKAFSRFHGVAPSHVKEHSVPLAMYNPLTIRVSMEGGRKIDYRIEKVSESRFLSIVKSFPVEIINDEGNDDIVKFWNECYQKGIVDRLKKFRSNEDKRIFGLCAPLKSNLSYFNYGIGVFIMDDIAKKDDNTLINTIALDNQLKQINIDEAKIDVWKLSEQDYAVFKCYGKNGDCIMQTWESFYKEFLPESGYNSCEKTDFEIYFDDAKNDLFCELWIPVSTK